ncbi:G-protein coupled receptor Mth2-like [Culicoides brevitarsis]|uniref:G-protein coupled receptor Mth2-like n=1 Tax=Culicoides brevitarsis TaxID=469753 RepID=UPI00307B686A
MSCLAVFLLLFALSSAADPKTRRCCSREIANFTEIGEELYCPDGKKFNLECKRGFAVVVDFQNLDEVADLFEFCYVGEFLSEVDDNKTEFSAAICAEEPYYALFYDFLPISVVFLAATFVIYYKIRTLRAPEDIAFMIAVLCLGVFMLIQVLHHWLADFHELYVVFSFVDLYIGPFAIVAYFSWLNVIMANQLKKNISSHSMSVSRNWIYLNHIYAWGIPSLVLFGIVISVLTHGMELEIEVLESYDYWKYVPIAILWAINCVLLALVIYFAIRCPSEWMNRRVIQYRSWKYFQLFLVSGFLWIFELLSWFLKDNEAAQPFFEVTDCINALQGLFLFIVMVILRLHVRRSLAGTRIFCFTLPQKWSSLEDADDVELIHNPNLDEAQNRI